MAKYHWWDGADLSDFFAKVNRLGSDNVNIRFDLKSELLFVDPKESGGVTASSHESDDGYNFTHTCPPDCEDDDDGDGGGDGT